MLGVWHALGQQLGEPRGRAGVLVGSLMRAANNRPTQLAITALDLKLGDKVLDMGFGPGHAIQLMAAQVDPAVICGIDRSETMLRQAARANRVAIAQGRVKLVLGDFTHLPYADASFDKVLASNVIYFWSDAAIVLAEIKRILRPQGTLVVYATDAASMRRWKFTGTGTHQLFDAAALAKLFASAGFSADEATVRKVAITRNVIGLIATVQRGAGAVLPKRTGPTTTAEVLAGSRRQLS